MRPFSICYGLMSLALGSLVLYGVMNANDLRSPFGDTRVFAANAEANAQPTVLLPPARAMTAAPASTCTSIDAAPTAATNSVIEPAPAITAGMSTAEIHNLLGEPDSTSADGARWTYGSSVLIFNNDALAGQIEFDPIQAALNKYNHMVSSIEAANPQASSKTAKSTGPKVLHAKLASKFTTRQYYRPVAAGSARQAFRYNRNHEEYSYYMNRAGPMDRHFTTKKFMPRGMMTTTERNLAQSYLNYGAARYSTSPSNQVRR